jgi:hypothetical protein
VRPNQGHLIQVVLGQRLASNEGQPITGRTGNEVQRCPAAQSAFQSVGPGLQFFWCEPTLILYLTVLNKQKVET